METNSTEYIEGVNSNQIVLSVLQEEFPGLTQLPSQAEAEYVARTVTPVYEAEGAINHYPELVPLDRSENGVIQIDGDDDTKSLNIPLQKLMFVDADNYNEIIDTDYHYFIDVVDDEVDDLPDIVGKFIIRTKIPIPTVQGPTTDIHVYYLLQNAFDNLQYLSVFYGKEVDGKPILYRIPDYKTLEVMLASRDQRYNSIEIIEPATFNRLVQRTLSDTISIEQLNGLNNAIADAANDNSLTADQRLNMYVKELPIEISQANIWTIQTRFNAGYEPQSPYRRDPVDYVGQTIGTELPTFFDKATSLEKLRDKFENRIVLFKSLNDSTARLDVGQFANADNEDLEGCRILFYGRWRPVFDIDILTLYATENNAPLDFPVNNSSGVDILNLDLNSDEYSTAVRELRIALQSLIDAGAVTVLNEDGVNSPIWNSFPHALTPLSINEYKEYLKLADVFDVEYLAPYEPRGSVKYYDPSRNGERGSLLFPGNRQIDPDSGIVSIKTDLIASIDTNISRLTGLLSDINSEFDSGQQIVGSLTNWKSIADDIVDGENNRFKYSVSRSGAVVKRGTGTLSLDRWLRDNAIVSSVFDPLGFFGASSELRNASEAFSFNNDVQRSYKEKINQINTSFEGVLALGSNAKQIAEDNIAALDALKGEIQADTFVTTFDNYQNRIDALGSVETTNILSANINALSTQITLARNAYTTYLSVLNREVGEAKSALGGITLRISDFRSLLAANVPIDDNIINNLI
jgi:hypothetical protein